MEFSPETAVGAVTLLGGASVLLQRMGLLRLGKGSKKPDCEGCQKLPPAAEECPDADCQSVVTQTHHDVKALKKGQDKLSDAFFGEDGTGGMVKTMHGVEWCIKSMAKEKGITVPD